MFAALLDTSALWPSLQRDVLLSFAVEGLYRPLWSRAILEELELSETQKLRGQGRSDAAARAARLVERMATTFDDALVEGWEPLEGGFRLPDPDDEHVLAAAVVGGAGAIVTSNLRDFPEERLPFAMRAITPEWFAHDTVTIDPYRALRALDEIARRSGTEGRPRRAVESILAVMRHRYGMQEAVMVLEAADRAR